VDILIWNPLVNSSTLPHQGRHSERKRGISWAYARNLIRPTCIKVLWHTVNPKTHSRHCER